MPVPNRWHSRCSVRCSHSTSCLEGRSSRQLPHLRGVISNAARFPVAGSISAKYISARSLATAPMSTDAFVVVEEITATVQNEPPTVNLDRLYVVRRMAVTIDTSPGR